ncbi:MAG TPA: thiamine pyrophosphate-dependent dehydrogenase E1 component subunit alpha, partial [Thermomicrobiales bacterium]|nr:thiamine pyrophosphate-dependent dehydrogenase E1 component subunit alpha [Thermomicrobiales bacterium]
MATTEERLAPAHGSTSLDDLSHDLLLQMYEKMWQARRVSERALALHRAGAVHLAVPSDGHEAVQVGSALAMPPQRTVVYPYYRSWAAVQAFGMTPLDIFFAVFARSEDPSSAGRQMPGHFCRADLRIITTSSVIATQLPHAAGAALASKMRGADDVVITYFGDGATSEGDFHEGLNFAAIHKLPVIFVCENNEYAISVPLSKQSAVSDLALRADGYGMPGVIVDGNDVVAVYRATREAVERADRGEGPTFIEAKTFRTGPHTSDDDDRGYRPREITDAWRRERDPILLFEQRLREAGILTDDVQQAIQTRVSRIIEEAITSAERAPHPDASE